MSEIPLLVSNLDATRPSLDWLQRVTLCARAYLDADPKRPEAEHLRQVVRLGVLAERAVEQGDARGAATAAIGAMQAAWQAEMVQGRVVVADGFRKRVGDANRTRKTVRARQLEARKNESRNKVILAEYEERQRRRESCVAKTLAKRYGLSEGTVRNIVRSMRKAAK